MSDNVTKADLSSITFSEEDVREPARYIKVGIHEVTITKAFFDKNKNGKIFLHVDVKTKDDEVEKAKLWFIGKATPISLNAIRTVFVHNAETEEDKQKLRDYFSGLEGRSLSELNEVVPNLVGKQAWIKKERSEEDWIDDEGNSRPNYETNLYGFEPVVSTKKVSVDSSTDTVPKFVPDDKIDLSEIPF